jgi:hypothetical protein
VDDDVCLAGRWGGDYKCAGNIEYCEGEYSADMDACCAKSCNKCCSDNDVCLADRWGGDYKCAGNIEYCEGAY